MNSKIRHQVRQQRLALSDLDIQLAAQNVFQRISPLEFFTTSQQIGFYMPVSGELSPQLLLDFALQYNTQCYLPALDPNKKDSLLFMSYYKGDTLIKNCYGIKEPEFDENKIINTQDLDCVFVPLVAFDKQGHRLGMGKGYYDRTFAFVKEKKKPYLIGLAYEFQLQEKIETQKWDVSLQAVVTDRDIYYYEVFPSSRA